LRDCQRVSRATDRRGRRRVDVQRRAAAVRRWNSRSFGGNARLRPEARYRQRLAGAAVVGLRRQDHHIPPARGVGARRAQAVFSANERRLDARGAAAGWRHAARWSGRLRARSRRPVSGVVCGAAGLAAAPAPSASAGRVTAEAYAAMQRLRRSGLLVVPVTGRPAGWCDHIARVWPVDAVVGENGALYMIHDDRARKLIKRYAVGDAERQAARARLIAVGERIVRAEPGCAFASDQPYREADLAIDYCEDVAPLSREAV